MGDIARMITHGAETTYTLDDYIEWLRRANFPLVNQTWGKVNEERIEADFQGLVTRAYQSNGVVFACELTRFMVFSQARFAWRQLRNGQEGEMFGTADLRVLEAPEPGRVTADLLTSAMLDADLAGDWFAAWRPGPMIKRLRPDWTVVIIGSPNVDYPTPADDPDAVVVGYQFFPGGTAAPTSKPWSLLASEVAHFFPIPDPLAKYRGMPLITAVVREISGDTQATDHKSLFWQHAATPNLVVKFPAGLDKEKAKGWINLFEQEHAGLENAYRTIYLGAGGDVQPVGSSFRDMDYSNVQGAGESRIAAAMGVHPVVVGLSEGLRGSALNAGNFDSAVRLTAGKTWYPMWNNLAGSLHTIIRPLPGTRLAPDTRGIAILAENAKDAAEVVQTQAEAITKLTTGGFGPDASVDAVTSGDLRRLIGAHSGLYSVQLQPPGTQVQAIRTFWPESTAMPPVTVERGTALAYDHPLVRAYPSLFGPTDARDPR